MKIVLLLFIFLSWSLFAQEENIFTYEVKNGDTLYQVLNDNGVNHIYKKENPIPHILKLNPFLEERANYHLFAGDLIRIPTDEKRSKPNRSLASQEESCECNQLNHEKLMLSFGHMTYYNNFKVKGLEDKAAIISSNVASGQWFKAEYQTNDYILVFKARNIRVDLVPDNDYYIKYGNQNLLTYSFEYLKSRDSFWVGAEYGFTQNLYLQTPGTNVISATPVTRMFIGGTGKYHYKDLMTFTTQLGVLMPKKDKNNFLNLGQYFHLTADYDLLQIKDKGELFLQAGYSFENNNPNDYQQFFNQVYGSLSYRFEW